MVLAYVPALHVSPQPNQPDSSLPGLCGSHVTGVPTLLSHTSSDELCPPSLPPSLHPSQDRQVRKRMTDVMSFRLTLPPQCEVGRTHTLWPCAPEEGGVSLPAAASQL